MESKNITIIDVARKAGVSKGTVDRVIHNRGEVSKTSAEKVRKAIKDLNYEPNLFASLLASKKARVIAGLFPTSSEGEYWQIILQGFNKGGELVANKNVHTRPFLFNQYDLNSFKAACESILESEVDGVVLTPLFRIEALSFIGQLRSRGIPYVFVDTRLEDNDYLAYFGMPMYKSGYLCAHLLTERCKPEEVTKVAVVRIKRDKTGQSDPTARRREGFLDFMAEQFPSCEIMNIFIDPSSPESIDEVLTDALSTTPDTKLMVMFNSRVHLTASFLAKHRTPGYRVVGFDALPQNLEMLSAGLVDILIAQHAETQSQRAVEVLSDNILMQKVAAERDNYMHMDILTRLNQDNY